MPAHPLPHIPDHELLRTIGKGSYGEVWLARSLTGKYRAVKIVYRSSFDHARPYEREFAGVQKFEPVSRTHETQVDILHVGRNDADGYFYYIMEVADDQLTGQEINPDNYNPWSLRSNLFQKGRLPVQECITIGLHLAAALDHIHENGLVHRDVKPSNIIFIDQVPKLADVGLVTSSEATRSFVGTDGYIPPEGPGSPQADIYSLGKVLYEISTGRNRLDFPELPTLLKDSPEREAMVQFNEVVLKACEEDPQRRYQSAAEMLADLQMLKSGKPLRAVRRRFGAKKNLIAVVAAGVLVAGSYFGGKMFQVNSNPLASMVLVPAGSFMMGDTLDGETDALPVDVNVSAFYMDAYLVSYRQWLSVCNWATTHGYHFVHPGAGKAPNHPVHTIDWFDMVKWCNARSQKAGLTPVYYTDTNLTRVLTNEETRNVFADWTANGYRLPTEAEWEKAARGGLTGKRYPWGDTFSETQANCHGNIETTNQNLGKKDHYATFITGRQPYTSPVGYFEPNGYGLYDMAGNVFQVCWDWYAKTYSGGTDPRGPATGTNRVMRGGAWNGYPFNARCCGRVLYTPTVDLYYIGFRCVCAAEHATVSPNTAPETEGNTMPAVATKKVERGMALIPAGPFTMGDNLDGEGDAIPTVTVNVSAFYMDVNLVSYGQWQVVYNWAKSHGYQFVHPGAGKAPNHPVHTIDWYDTVKWCNARSQQAGLTAVYYTDSGLSNVYLKGEMTPYVNWRASGFRLPTEAEWEKAARGGLQGQRFPWGNTITEKQANYFGDTARYSYDLGPSGFNSAFISGDYPYTSPVGYFTTNGYGLYDMAGNEWEWCWDWYTNAYAGGGDPHGPESGTDRIWRGGNWSFVGGDCERCAERDYNKPNVANYVLGFRCVSMSETAAASPSTAPETEVKTVPAVATNKFEHGMALIPAGPFTMGDNLDGEGDASPTMTIMVSAFYMDTNLVSYGLWQSVYSYATNRGYDFVNSGTGAGTNYPVGTLDWYDTIKWCNARSQQAGLTPVYYEDAGLTQVYIRGESTNVFANWTVTGYRLPTEAEWEKAARGGLTGQRFPCGNTISESQANYAATAAYTYDLGPIGYNPVSKRGQGGESPVGSFAPNGFGLYDMAGNELEWCWDWYGTPYGQPTTNNPTGPATGMQRVFRGGNCVINAFYARCANRFHYSPSGVSYSPRGFRCVRGH